MSCKSGSARALLTFACAAVLMRRLSPVTCSVDVGKSPDIPYVYVSHDGLVRNYKPIQVVTACTLNIYNFPFDVQKCSLTFQSWLHTSKTPPPPRERQV